MKSDTKNQGLPLVSICMPAYNAGPYIKAAIQSILYQTYNNWELIIVNDGSTDDTSEVLASIASDKRIQIINTVNGGAARARNTAYAVSTGGYIVFFDADDFLGAAFLSTQIAKSQNWPQALILADWGRFYNDNQGTITQQPIAFDEMQFNEWINCYWYQCNPMTNPGRALIPRCVIEKAGVWNEQLSLNDDLEFFTRIMLNSDKIVFNHDAVLGYRSGISGLSSALGQKAMSSLFNSTWWSVKLVLDHYGSQEAIRKSCANMLQYFIYIAYPVHPDLVKKAEQQLSQLPAPTIEFPCGGYTKCLVKLVNWKIVKRVKNTFANSNKAN